MELNNLVSAIYNDIVAGLSGYTSTPTISFEQLEDECIEMRSYLLKEYYLKGAINPKDYAIALNCVDVDCADPDKCCKTKGDNTALHFEIPQLVNDLGESAIIYIGSTDRQHSFKVYMNPTSMKLHKYKGHGKDKPYVYIEPVPNKNNMFDGWIYNLPFVKQIAVIGIFKDLRQLQQYNCCQTPDFTDFGVISTDIKDKLVQKKLAYYRQYLQQPHPTDGIPR